MRIAVIGQGSAGKRHAQFLLTYFGLDVVAYDPYVPPARGIEQASTLENALSGADAAVIASPSSLHAEQAREAIEAGVPTLVEKPPATNATEALKLEKLAAKHGVPLAVAMNMRHHSGVIGLRTRLQTVGRVLRASAWCGSWLPGWHPGEDYRRGYSAQEMLGGGVLLDVAVHELDYLIWLLGRVKAVTAVVRRVSDLEIDVEDTGLLLLELESGVIADVVVDYLDHAYHRGCRIVGSLDSIGETLEPSLVTYRDGLEQFLALIRGEDATVATVGEAVHVLEVIDAARRSSAESKRVEVSRAVVESPAPKPVRTGVR